MRGTFPPLSSRLVPAAPVSSFCARWLGVLVVWASCPAPGGTALARPGLHEAHYARSGIKSSIFIRLRNKHLHLILEVLPENQHSGAR